MIEIKKIHAKYLLMSTLLLAVGGFVGWHIRKPVTPDSPLLIHQIRANFSKYKHINPLLFLETTKEKTSTYEPLEQSLTAYINQNIDEKKIQSASVYFRDVNSGRWTGVNEEEGYTPSSLLKVAVMMSVLRKADENPEVLSQKMYYDPAQNIGRAQTYFPEKNLKAGYYSVEELMESMIADSDNAANSVLMKQFNVQFSDLYATFRLPDLPDNFQNFMSPKSYSVLFRGLYNATYISEKNSEQALKLLAKTNFNSGLRGGVPQGITVAHKFGENTLAYSDGKIKSRELHDCGIVYYPNQPYFICVMTEGSDFKELETIINRISQMIYMYVDGMEV